MRAVHPPIPQWTAVPLAWRLEHERRVEAVLPAPLCPRHPAPACAPCAPSPRDEAMPAPRCPPQPRLRLINPPPALGEIPPSPPRPRPADAGAGAPRVRGVITTNLGTVVDVMA